MTQNAIVYPPGVRELTDDISTDDLVRRLKECAQAFQSMSQDDDNSAYIPLAEHLVSETFLEHPSRDVRLLVACCIADVFRVYAPDAPYKDAAQLKVIFEFFVDQLKGLEDPSKPSFKSHFYLLENFACVKTFNICVELEDTQKILCRLFRLMFKIINENHSAKVKKFILDMLSPLISEADTVSQELLDVILSQIIEPIKTKNRNACSLAQDILKRNISALDQYIQSFLNNALILGKTGESDLTCHLYELIYELNGICPSMLIVVLPQLEFKIKSNEEKERLNVAQLLGRMFSDKNSTMIVDNKTLWSCYLQRFNDISAQVRLCCVQYCKSFLLNHPESKKDITDHLRFRHRDADENVRYEVVVAIVGTAKEDFSCINEDLLSFVKERTLDKKFKIRKEALLGLAMVYKNKMGSNLASDVESISWIKNKVLHAYYQTSLEDRLLVERILHTCLVPYQKPMEERMKLLYHLFCSIDDYAVKSFKEIMKLQNLLRSQVRNILEVIQCEKNDKTLPAKVSVLSKNLQDPVKSKDCIMKFCKDLESNIKLRSLMSVILNNNISCSEAEQKVKEVLKLVCHPQTNTYYMIIKQLLERIAPVMIDKEGICFLVDYVKDSLLGDCAIEAELGLENSSRRGLELLWVLTFVYPSAFHDESILNNLLLFLQVEDDIAADMTLQIFMNVSRGMNSYFPEFCARLLSVLKNFVETGTAKQAKHAVYCIYSIVPNKEDVFGAIIQNLKAHLTLESQYFRTALVSIGHIAYLCHNMFATDLKYIVAQTVVKDLLMKDSDLPRGGEDTWGPLDSLPDETKVKIEGMKVMVRWLLGLKDMVQPAISTLRLLMTVINNGGDLMERQHTAPIENSWMRISAANCMLKLCQEPKYADALLPDQFVNLAYMMDDDCPEVRDRFVQKVHKGLLAFKLPLEFLAIFSLAALDKKEEFQKQVKTYLLNNINKRKEYIKQRTLTGEKLLQFLPDYALPYAVYILAHYKDLKSYNDIPNLKKIKDCLWFLMEPLMNKNENYSFSFFKRLLENIKQTKDKQTPDDPETNMKLYAVSDLALSIIMSKTTNFVLKEFPGDPTLPGKLFTDPDPSYSNLKTYLPPELAPDNSVQKSGMGIELFEDSTKPSTVSQEKASEVTDAGVDDSQNQQIIPDSSSKQKEKAPKTVSEARTTRNRLRTRKKSNKDVTDSETTSESKKVDSNMPPNAEHSPESVKDNDSSMQEQEPSSEISVNSTALPVIKNVEIKLRPLRSSRSASSASIKSSNSNISMPREKQNGIITSKMNIHAICSPDIQNSLKECNVSLRKDEVERYIALNNSTSESLDGSCLSDSDISETPVKHKNKSNSSDTPIPSKKRKREEHSPVSSSPKSKSSSRIAEKMSDSSSQSSKSKTVSKSNSSPIFTKSNNDLKKGNKLSLVNGNRSNKVQKSGTSQKSEKSVVELPLTRRQKNLGKLNLRKR